MIKRTINTWDLFDTLVTRFEVTPQSVFRILQKKITTSGLLNKRLLVQRDLDIKGKPYTIFDIYKIVETQYHISEHDCLCAMNIEISTEFNVLIPIQRQIERVAHDDIIVSDMYLSADIIQDIIRCICRLHVAYPCIVGNWGKHVGSIWPYLLNKYNIRCHYGDNLHSDATIPTKFHINTEHITDAALNPWEKRISNEGFEKIAFLAREIRLRNIKNNHDSFHTIVVGPYMVFLICSLLYINKLAKQYSKIVFVSRDCCHVSFLYRMVFNHKKSELLDMTRLILMQDCSDAIFNDRIIDGSLVIDMISSSKTINKFRNRTKRNFKFLTFLYFHALLSQNEKANHEQQKSDGTLQIVAKHSEFNGSHANFEVLLDPGFPSAIALNHDTVSGALIKEFAFSDLTLAEYERVGFVNQCVTDLGDCLLKRGCDENLSDEILLKVLKIAMSAIIENITMVNYFPTYIVKELKPNLRFS